MSVILEALQSENKNKENEKKTDSSSGEGLFVSKSGFEVKRPIKIPKRLVILIGALFLVLSFTLTIYFISYRPMLEEENDISKPVVKQTLSKKISQVFSKETKIPVHDLSEAVSQFNLGRYDDSFLLLKRLLKTDPDNAKVHANLGMVLLKKSQFVEAEKHLLKGIELDDQCAPCYNDLGYLKTLQNDLPDAEGYLNQAIQIQPNYSYPHFNLAVLFEKQGEIGKAAESYQKFLEILPKEDADMSEKVKEHLRELTGQ